MIDGIDIIINAPPINKNDRIESKLNNITIPHYSASTTRLFLICLVPLYHALMIYLKKLD